MKYNGRGEEIPDDTPLESPVKFRRPPSIQELIAMHVKAAMQVERKMGKEDEEDFDEHDETDDILTPYELHAYAGEADLEMRRAQEAQDLIDKVEKRKYNRVTVDEDRVKENEDVQQSGTKSDSKGVGDAGKESGKNGVERGTAG